MPIEKQQVQQIGSIELLAKQVVEGFITGLHKSPFHGFSVEFAEHRLYNKGESTRHIDWRLFGRTDKLFVKRYEEETNLRCQIIIDNSSSMHYPEVKEQKQGLLNKISFSAHCAAAIMHLLRMQRDAVGLSIFSESVEQHTAAKSNLVHHKLLYHLLEQAIDNNQLENKKGTSAAQSIHQIAEQIHKRSLVVIFSDMFESHSNSNELFNALQHLKYNKHEVVLFHVTDKQKELEFMFDNKPYLFIDVETNEKIKVHAASVKEKYKEAVAQFKHELKLRCAQYHIDFVEADIHLGYRQVLLPYLIKRQKML
ncbi:MAG TPA: DUF58 domain-containing protein [Bacteroidia bacterium]|nr:DUF58 domain-containing protein [Bacteroidia bacterium]HNT81096.1 DUF58 domain-containing protein [Bacteroidia bacterium]